MLKLTRYLGQSVRIGKDVVVTILEIQDGRISLGFNAPKEISVHRMEIYFRSRRRVLESRSSRPLLSLPSKSVSKNCD